MAGSGPHSFVARAGGLWERSPEGGEAPGRGSEEASGTGDG